MPVSTIGRISDRTHHINFQLIWMFIEKYSDQNQPIQAGERELSSSRYGNISFSIGDQEPQIVDAQLCDRLRNDLRPDLIRFINDYFRNNSTEQYEVDEIFTRKRLPVRVRSSQNVVDGSQHLSQGGVGVGGYLLDR